MTTLPERFEEIHPDHDPVAIIVIPSAASTESERSQHHAASSHRPKASSPLRHEVKSRDRHAKLDQGSIHKITKADDEHPHSSTDKRIHSLTNPAGIFKARMQRRFLGDLPCNHIRQGTPPMSTSEGDAVVQRMSFLVNANETFANTSSQERLVAARGQAHKMMLKELHDWVESFDKVVDMDCCREGSAYAAWVEGIVAKMNRFGAKCKRLGEHNENVKPAAKSFEGRSLWRRTRAIGKRIVVSI